MSNNWQKLLSIIKMLSPFGCKSKKQGYSNNYKMDKTYIALREQVFSLNPEKIGLNRENSKQACGFVLETRYPEGVFTLVALADGSISIYYSSGGGTIGLGQNEQLQIIAKNLLDIAEDCINLFTLDDSRPLPKLGTASLYIITWDGIYTASEDEAHLGNGKSNLLPLFHKAHELISANLTWEEKKQKE